MRKILLLISFIGCVDAVSQELYPYSEPASNMPSKSIGLKHASMFMVGVHSDKLLHRQMPEVMFGINKKLMVHVGTLFSNMHEQKFIWEGARVYAKYRFLSVDDVHKHFRMAAFAGGTYSKNHLDHNEINIAMGEQSGIQGGLIATQLWNKFALSATGSWNEVINEMRKDKYHREHYVFTAANYSLSAGYLLLPFNYKSYDQTNVNLYLEVLGSRNIDVQLPNNRYYVDLAPSLQLIFKSTAKLNFSYRFQVKGDIYRLSNESVMVSYEHIFLNALKKKKKS